MPDLLKLTIAILATWRISASLYYGKEFADLRYQLTAETDDDGVPLSWWGRQIECFWCVSFWVAWPVALFIGSPAWFVFIPFALSGAVILLSGGGRTLWREMTQ